LGLSKVRTYRYAEFPTTSAIFFGEPSPLAIEELRKLAKEFGQ
jgi:hypothetical protein